MGALKFPTVGLLFSPAQGPMAREGWTAALKLAEATLSLDLDPACRPVLKPNMANAEERGFLLRTLVQSQDRLGHP